MKEGSADASNGVPGFDSPSATNSVKIKSPKAEMTEPLMRITLNDCKYKDL